MKVVAVIPCFNEALFIGEIVKKTQQYVDKVLVVDNGSYDDTVIVARKNGAEVIYNHEKGMGSVTKKGLSYLDSDIYVTLDGDGQHNPLEIPKLLQPILENRADLVVGVRQNDVNMPAYRKFGNDTLSRIYNCSSKVNLSDVQCGFRAFNNKVRDIPISSTGFGCVFELLVKVRKLNYRIVPVEVSCVYHQDLNQNSTVHPLKQGLVVTFGAIKWRIWECL